MELHTEEQIIAAAQRGVKVEQEIKGSETVKIVREELARRADEARDALVAVGPTKTQRIIELQMQARMAETFEAVIADVLEFMEQVSQGLLDDITEELEGGPVD